MLNVALMPLLPCGRQRLGGNEGKLEIARLRRNVTTVAFKRQHVVESIFFF